MNTPCRQSLALAALLYCLPFLAAAQTLTAQPPVELKGTQGKFDFIKIDPLRNRLLACHTGNGSLDVIDLASGKLIKSVPTGAAQGVALDDQGGRYFVSASKPPQLVVVDATKLEVTDEVPLPGPADLVAYHAATKQVFVCNDEKPEMWIIDPEAKKITATLTLPGAGMEDLEFDDSGKYLFQCLKDSSALAEIDPVAGKLIATWPALPAEKPHGLAIVPGTGTLLVAGGTGTLMLMSSVTGKVIASCMVAPRIDEIAYDPGMRRLYGASSLGTVSVIEVHPNALTPLPPLISSPGAHSIAVDPSTHTVWIAFAKEGNAYLQTFSVQAK